MLRKIYYYIGHTKPYCLKKLFTLLVLLGVSLILRGQTQPFGKVDTADLKLNSCDFEKDANAMVLFDKTEITTGFTSTTVLRFKRIKILNDAGKDEANVNLEYYSRHSIEDISDVEAETINLDKNTIERIKLEKSAIYHQTIDKTTKKISFTFPGVKAGSIIEYSYKVNIGFEGVFPDWNFQGKLPVRYCELRATIRNDYSYKMTPRIHQPYAQNTSEYWINKNGDTLGKKYVWALKNVNSFREEPFSTSLDDDIQKMAFRLTAYKYTARSDLKSLEKSWFQIASSVINDEDFGQQLNQNIKSEGLINKAKSYNTDNEKISYIFNRIKNDIKWNGINRWYTIDGIGKAWDKKQGNSTEINLILYYFLIKSGIKCYPELVSTRENGRIDINYPNLEQFNKTVINVPLANKKFYILDASDKYNNYQDIPYDILNSNGFLLNKDSNIYILSFLKSESPSRKVVFVNAGIAANGKMSGTTQINNFSYHKADAITAYTTDGEEKYKVHLRENDNNLKISSLKLENMDVDSLPLTQSVEFNLDLTSSDENYIFFSPNLFTGFTNNPFRSEGRNSDINLKFLRNYVINGRYKIPDRYKIESLPKSGALLMPDTSISFKRIVAEQEGYIIVHYVIDYKRTYYLKDEYQALYAFYKKMHEMLNEQIVLKKL